MWRSNQQVQAANRAARPFLGLVTDQEGEVWRFWALAPVKVAGADAVWLTTGARFRVALVDRVSGAVWWSRVPPMTVAEVAARQAGFSKLVRMADDVVTDTALFGSSKSTGCPCSACAPAATRRAALARYATAAAAA